MTQAAILCTDGLTDCLQSLGLKHWQDALLPLVAERLSARGHGDFAKWADALDGVSAAIDATTNNQDGTDLKQHLLQLSPWRKGPFDISGVRVDAEWRSDLKWARVQEQIAPLRDRNVLDVGCGNGYYALQMRDAGARAVIGVDPTVLFIMQFLAVNRFAKAENVFVLPARLQELPLPAKKFDTTFSMGVLYHQRSPIDHLRELRQTLRPDGQLVLETIYVPGEESYACTPADRYARMRNVWLLPTLAELTTWLQRSGYTNIQFIDRSLTTIEEQRSTEWMSFESLREALDPADPMKTVEGWPAPHRVVLTANSP